MSAEDGRMKDALKNVAFGTPEFKMSRREWVAGAIGAVLSGATHNLTPSGIDTKTLPLSQIVGGGVLWSLQRKFGFLANTTAHAVHNLWALRHVSR
jgi:hypothetical protein